MSGLGKRSGGREGGKGGGQKSSGSGDLEGSELTLVPPSNRLRSCFPPPATTSMSSRPEESCRQRSEDGST